MHVLIYPFSKNDLIFYFVPSSIISNGEPDMNTAWPPSLAKLLMGEEQLPNCVMSSVTGEAWGSGGLGEDSPLVKVRRHAAWRR